MFLESHVAETSDTRQEILEYREGQMNFAGGDGLTVNSSRGGSDRETVCPEVRAADDEIPHGDQDLVNPFRHDLEDVRHVKYL